MNILDRGRIGMGVATALLAATLAAIPASAADPPGTKGDRLSYEALDLNNRGEIVGFCNDEDGFTMTGFLRDRKGPFTDIAVPGSRVTGPFRINDPVCGPRPTRPTSTTGAESSAPTASTG